MSAGKQERDILGRLRPSPGDLAFVDGLTGLYNQRYLTSLLEDNWDEMIELSGSLALVMIDLNLFKEVNDRYGHLSGDEVLRLTAGILREHFRDSDLICRYGGDEFIALLPGASVSEAESLGERARNAMLNFEFMTPEEKKRIEISISFSIGVSVYPGDGENGRELLAAADERLYAEKRARGRSRRKQRMIVVGGAILAGAMVLTAGFLYLLDERSGEQTTPAVVVRPIQVETPPADLPEREALMAQLAELQAQIERLRTEQASAAEPGTSQIEALEEKIAELSAQLNTVTDVDESVPVEEPPRVELATDETEPPVVTEPVEVRVVPPPLPSTIEPPHLIERVILAYPPFAEERGIEAVIELEVSIDVQGRVVEAVVTSDRIGFGFEEAAQKAAMGSRWQPGLRDGIPMAMKTNLEVRFKLER